MVTVEFTIIIDFTASLNTSLYSKSHFLNSPGKSTAIFPISVELKVGSDNNANLVFGLITESTIVSKTVRVLSIYEGHVLELTSVSKLVIDESVPFT